MTDRRRDSLEEKASERVSDAKRAAADGRKRDFDRHLDAAADLLSRLNSRGNS